MKNKFRLISGLLTLVFITLGGKSLAATTAVPHGLIISPAYQMVTISPGSQQQPVTFKLTSNFTSAQNLSLSVADFNTLNESGGLFFVGANPTALQKKYGLAKWLTLPQQNLAIKPGQTVTVIGQINNLASLSPGGHYGALMVSLGSQNAKTGQVGIEPIASSLLFVTKPDGATHNLNLSDVFVKRSLFKLPTEVNLRFYNDGNTHLVPRGTVSLTSSNNELISKGIINEDSNIILPQTYRRYNVKLNNVSHGVFSGSYKLKVDFRFDGIDQYREYRANYFYVPVIMPVVLCVLALITVTYLLYRKVYKVSKK